MDKLLSKILKDMLKDNDLKELLDKETNQDKYNCEIKITRKGTELKTEASGSSIGMLIALKRVLDTMQKKFNISDEELELLMLSVISIDKSIKETL